MVTPLCDPLSQLPRDLTGSSVSWQFLYPYGVILQQPQKRLFLYRVHQTKVMNQLQFWALLAAAICRLAWGEEMEIGDCTCFATD